MEIAYDLAQGGATKVWLSARTPPNILMRTGPGGLPGDVIGRDAAPAARRESATPSRASAASRIWAT